MSLAYFFVMMYALGHFLSSPALSAAFLAPEPKVYLMVIFFSIVWEPVDFFINLLMKVLSRFNEYQADRYSVAADKKYARLLGDSLKKMMRKSKARIGWSGAACFGVAPEERGYGSPARGCASAGLCASTGLVSGDSAVCGSSIFNQKAAQWAQFGGALR
eukprot:g25904.t1